MRLLSALVVVLVAVPLVLCSSVYAEGKKQLPSPKSVNLNTADESALTSLPGIGVKKAEAIVSERKENGPFKDQSDFCKRVKGFKQGTAGKAWPKIEPYVNFGKGAAAAPVKEERAEEPEEKEAPVPAEKE